MTASPGPREPFSDLPRCCYPRGVNVSKPGHVVALVQRILPLALGVGLLLAPVTSSAAGPPEEEAETPLVVMKPPGKAPDAPGDAKTPFFAELSLGGAFGTGFPEGSNGVALRTIFGAGGRFGSFPPEFHFVLSIRYAHLLKDGVIGLQTYDLRRNAVDLSAGLRVTVPIGNFRILGEFQLGGTFLFSSVTLNDREQFDTGDRSFAVYFAFGLQYRLSRRLSLGLLSEFSLPSTRVRRDLVVDLSRIRDNGQLHGWVSLTATVTAHF